jgi:hypothetical protein
MKTRGLFLLMSILACVAGCADDSDADRPADLAFVNAKVFTSNTGKPWAEAVAVREGRIVYVGDCLVSIILAGQ